MSVVALRYAHAFAEVASSQKLDVAVAQQQLADFQATFHGSHELREVLMNPAISGDQKLKVVDAIASKIGMLPQVRNFIAVIMDRQRLGELDEILGEYHVIADENAGFTEAEITSARPLEGRDRTELEDQVARMVGGRVRATYKEDASLLGGAVVRVGSTVYDGSIRAQLQQLKQKLVSA
ncbi:MAG: ATP synthase F1 subunit delta [Edaphobacter sp.]|uniref:ATP synthase F1 subunit delta n=1 Tax=Edaphobacter sp. TaxID=1934404 RepID=UPI0023907DCD|nr:ATP synthase F1 subunit delta [Edaphobacter sp.]MDE1176260.1 ATP synthase F1 subunit delta [Edaphobacter sp.]